VSSQAAPFELIVEFEYTSSPPLSRRRTASTARLGRSALLAEPYQFS